MKAIRRDRSPRLLSLMKQHLKPLGLTVDDISYVNGDEMLLPMDWDVFVKMIQRQKINLFDRKIFGEGWHLIMNNNVKLVLSRAGASMRLLRETAKSDDHMAQRDVGRTIILAKINEVGFSSADVVRVIIGGVEVKGSDFIKRIFECKFFIDDLITCIIHFERKYISIEKSYSTKHTDVYFYINDSGLVEHMGGFRLINS